MIGRRRYLLVLFQQVVGHLAIVSSQVGGEQQRCIPRPREQVPQPHATSRATLANSDNPWPVPIARWNREPRSPERAATEPRPKPRGHPADGTTNVRWLLSRPSAGRCRPKRSRGRSQPALTRTRRHRTPPETARPPRRRHDECKVAFKPPVRWTLPAKTHSRELPTNSKRRLDPPSPSFPPTTSPAGCPRSGTSGLKATRRRALPLRADTRPDPLPSAILPEKES